MNLLDLNSDNFLNNPIDEHFHALFNEDFFLNLILLIDRSLDDPLTFDLYNIFIDDFSLNNIFDVNRPVDHMLNLMLYSLNDLMFNDDLTLDLMILIPNTGDLYLFNDLVLYAMLHNVLYRSLNYIVNVDWPVYNVVNVDWLFNDVLNFADYVAPFFLLGKKIIRVGNEEKSFLIGKYFIWKIWNNFYQTSWMISWTRWMGRSTWVMTSFSIVWTT
jgi:hypothetical protein